MPFHVLQCNDLSHLAQLLLLRQLNTPIVSQESAQIVFHREDTLDFGFLPCGKNSSCVIPCKRSATRDPEIFCNPIIHVCTFSPLQKNQICYAYEEKIGTSEVHILIVELNRSRGNYKSSSHTRVLLFLFL
jgi:hypothetical protein